MSELNPFEDLSKRVKTIEIGGKTIKIKPQIKDLAAFIAMGKEPKNVPPERVMEIEEKKTIKLTDTMIGILMRAYPKAKREDIEVDLMENYTTYMQEMTIAMGLTTRKELEKAMAKLNEPPLA